MSNQCLVLKQENKGLRAKVNYMCWDMFCHLSSSIMLSRLVSKAKGFYTL